MYLSSVTAAAFPTWQHRMNASAKASNVRRGLVRLLSSTGYSMQAYMYNGESSVLLVSSIWSMGGGGAAVSSRDIQNVIRNLKVEKAGDDF